MRQDIIDYQECIKLISDIHKHARGRRPSIEWMEWFNELPFEHQCEAVDQLLALGYEREDAETKAENENAASFRRRLRVAIRAGAQDVNTALRWLTDSEVFYSSQCIEHWVWEQGILFTPTGKAAVSRLIETATFQEWE